MAIFSCSLFLGCGSVNRTQTPQQRNAHMNRSDPMMTTHYLKARNVP